MMEKKYELVAWTRNVTDSENARLFIAPSVRVEMYEAYMSECAACRKELEDNHGRFTLQLARRFVRVYDQSARFEVLIGDFPWAIRFLLMAADYCTYGDDRIKANDELRSEFMRLCEDAVTLASRHGLEYILVNEEDPKRTIEAYRKRLRKAN